MQKDMHYHATLCIAYSAGFSEEAALQVATSCQFVDDNHGEHAFSGDKVDIEFKDGATVYLTPTAHHMIRAGVGAIANINEESQSSIWVPFHFIPGNEGNTFEEKMLTTKDSFISKKVVEHALENANKPYALQLLEITAHCYSDTFSHYGFSGLKSDLNNVIADSIDVFFKLAKTKKYVESKIESFLNKSIEEAKGWKMRFKSVIAGTSHLGHGAALTHPDRPYMNWSFEYEIERIPCTEEDDRKFCIRNNPETFLEACEALHGAFTRFLEKQPSYKGTHAPISFGGIKATAKEIIESEGEKSERCARWEEAFVSGFFGEHRGPFPTYLGEDWNDEVEQSDGMETAEEFLNSDVFKFYQAAEQHRAFVLRDLLPEFGLLVK